MARRTSRRRAQRTATLEQLPWQPVRNPRPPVEVLSPEQIDAIHDTSLRVLEEVGMRIDCPETRALLGDHGNHVHESTTHVRFDRGFIEQRVAMAPSSFKLKTRHPDRYLEFGGNNIVFGAVGGPAFVNDLDQGRRPGSMDAFRDSIRILQSLNSCHFMNSGILAPQDEPVDRRHLDTLFGCFTLTDKGMGASVLGRDRAQDAFPVSDA